MKFKSFKNLALASAVATASSASMAAGPLAVIIAPIQDATAGTPAEALIAPLVLIDDALAGAGGGGLPGLDALPLPMPGGDGGGLPGLDALPIPGLGGGSGGGDNPAAALAVIPVIGPIIADAAAGGFPPELPGGGGGDNPAAALEAIPVLGPILAEAAAGGGGGAGGFEDMAAPLFALTATVDQLTDDLAGSPRGSESVTDALTDVIDALPSGDPEVIQGEAMEIADSIQILAEHLQENLMGLAPEGGSGGDNPAAALEAIPVLGPILAEAAAGGFPPELPGGGGGDNPAAALEAIPVLGPILVGFVDGGFPPELPGGGGGDNPAAALAVIPVIGPIIADAAAGGFPPSGGGGDNPAAALAVIPVLGPILADAAAGGFPPELPGMGGGSGGMPGVDALEGIPVLGALLVGFIEGGFPPEGLPGLDALPLPV